MRRPVGWSGCTRRGASPTRRPSGRTSSACPTCPATYSHRLDASGRGTTLAGPPLDREVAALRHFVQFSRAETAKILGISEEAPATRSIPAMKRLKAILAARAGGLEGL